MSETPAPRKPGTKDRKLLHLREERAPQNVAPQQSIQQFARTRAAPSAATRARNSRSSGLIRASSPSSSGENAICPARPKEIPPVLPDPIEILRPPRFHLEIPARATPRPPAAPPPQFPALQASFRHPRNTPPAGFEFPRLSTAAAAQARNSDLPDRAPPSLRTIAPHPHRSRHRSYNSNVCERSRRTRKMSGRGNSSRRRLQPANPGEMRRDPD